MTNQKSSLYDVEWQVLRVNTLAQNTSAGGWNTEIGVEANLEKFRRYVMGTKDSQEYTNRLWRILNMLNAVRMGYNGTNQAGTNQDKAVILFRDMVSKRYNKIIDGGFVFAEWDWDKVAKDLKTLYQNSRSDFDKVYKNLVGRKNTAENNAGTSNRPELVKFVELMEATIEGAK